LRAFIGPPLLVPVPKILPAPLLIKEGWGEFESYFLIRIGFYGKSLKWRKAGFRIGGPEGEEGCQEEGAGKA
jgi:hypothetical protein